MWPAFGTRVLNAWSEFRVAMVWRVSEADGVKESVVSLAEDDLGRKGLDPGGTPQATISALRISAGSQCRWEVPS